MTETDGEFLLSRVRELEAEVVRLRSLEQVQGRLEVLAEERTRELSDADARLREELAERERAEAALRVSEDKFARVFHSSSVAMTLSGIEDGVVVDANEEFLRLVGRPREEVVGRSTLELNLWADPSQRETVIEILRREGRAVDVEAILCSRDGRSSVCLCTADRVAVDGRFLLLVSALDITARKRAEEALKRSEEMFAKAFHSNPDAIVVARVDGGRIVDVNESFTRHSGYTRAEAVGHTALDLNLWADPRDREWYSATLARLGRAPETEFRFRVKSGEERVGLIAAEILPFGEEACVFSAIRDVTEQRRAEEQLRLTQFAVDTAPDALYRVGPDARFFFVNEAASRMLGYSREELVAMGVADIDPSYDGARWVERWSQVRRGGQLTIETTHRRRDGTEFPVEIRGHYVEYRGGEYMSAFVRDVTDRKRSEEALAESEELYRTLFELESDAIFIIENGSGCILTANRAASELYGYGREELQGLRNTDLSAEPEDTRRVTTSTAVTPDRVVQVPLRRHRKKDGTVFPVEITGRFFEWHGRGVHIAAIRDVSERQRADEERRRLEEQMRHVQKLESLGVLAGGIAHDFNNLLMAILGNADLALLNLSPLHPARDRLKQIEAASQRAADLCRQMLAYSGRGCFVVERVDLSELVEEMGHILKVSISKKAALRYDLASGLAPVEADPSQLRQVVMNLITNASEALGDEAGGIVVTTGQVANTREDLVGGYFAESLPKGTCVYVEVADTGCGMDEATKERIFDPFFTTKFAGRGLGLAAVQGIVRGHRGAIALETAPGRGTTFRVLFPAVPEDADAKGSRGLSEGGWEGDGLILLADDEESVRGVAREMLEALGLRVLTAADGVEAVELFRERGQEITGVVLDLTMPRMGGDEALEEVRRLRADVPVVLMSGYSDEELSRQLLGRDRAGILQKPFTLAQLGEVLRRVAAVPAVRGAQ